MKYRFAKRLELDICSRLQIYVDNIIRYIVCNICQKNIVISSCDFELRTAEIILHLSQKCKWQGTSRKDYIVLNSLLISNIIFSEILVTTEQWIMNLSSTYISSRKWAGTSASI